MDNLTLTYGQMLRAALDGDLGCALALCIEGVIMISPIVIVGLAMLATR